MKRKFFCAAIVAVVGSMLVAGTFAWTNFGAQIINSFFGQGGGDLQSPRGPGGTLHNDFVEGEDYRDIYIENWGTEPMIVRVHLSEYMEVGPGAGNSANNEAVSFVEGALLSDPETWTPFAGEMDGIIRLDDADASSFRDYWRWTMGGQKYFFPAPEDQRGNHNGVEFVSTTSPPNLSPSALDIVSQTLSAEVLTMDEWISQGEPIGHYWVVDTDGFSYWAAPLLPDEATGLLLHKIEQIRTPVYDYFYALNVQGHMATIDDAPDNYERMLTDASENASRLINQLAGVISSMYDEPAPPRTFTIEEPDGGSYFFAPLLELIYEDDHNRFYLSSMRSNHIVLTFEDGLRVTLRIALDARMVTVDDLIANGLDVIVMPAGTPTPGTPTPATPGTPLATPTRWPDGFTPTPRPPSPTPWPDGFTPTPRTPTNTPTPFAGTPTPTSLPDWITPLPPTNTPTPFAGTPTPFTGTHTPWWTPAPTVIHTPTFTPTPWPPGPTMPPYWWLTPTSVPDWITPHPPTNTPTPFAGTPTPFAGTPTPWWVTPMPNDTPILLPLDITPTPYAGSPTPTAWPEGGAMPSPTLTPMPN